LNICGRLTDYYVAIVESKPTNTAIKSYSEFVKVHADQWFYGEHYVRKICKGRLLGKE
jgi:hypothetical protein